MIKTQGTTPDAEGRTFSAEWQKLLKAAETLGVEFRIGVLLTRTFRFRRSLSQVWPATGTPAIATLTSGMAAAFAALLIQLEVLVEMMSIGKTLSRITFGF